MNKITEYTITYIDQEADEYNTADKKEADEQFAIDDKKEVDQYYRKDWVMVNGDWCEDYVEVYYNNEEVK